MNTGKNGDKPRREFLRTALACLGAGVFLGPAKLLAAAPRETKAVEVTPPEDLMREHGVLRRLMLIFDNLGGRLQGGVGDFSPAPLTQAVGLIRRFIQDYHEKDEEDYLFPRFEKAGKMTGLVKVLREQHQAGRKLIGQVERLAAAANLKTGAGRAQVGGLLRAFNRMYRPHAAREDTVLYPAFRSVITPAEFDALGDTFEDREQKLFGKDGFEKIVAQVAGLEKQLQLYDLAQFTPRL
jgi:hemerythrin-like domain-containing protein